MQSLCVWGGGGGDYLQHLACALGSLSTPVTSLLLCLLPDSGATLTSSTRLKSSSGSPTSCREAKREGAQRRIRCWAFWNSDCGRPLTPVMSASLLMAGWVTRGLFFLFFFGWFFWCLQIAQPTECCTLLVITLLPVLPVASECK